MSVGPIVNLVAGKIGDLIVQEAKLLYGVDDQVRSLQRELTMMSGFLDDMEDMDEEGGYRLTRTVINEIRKIAYDAEDVIESYILEASSSSTLFKRYVCFCTNLVRIHQVGSEIEAIKVRIAETTENWKKYRGENGVKRNVGEGMNRARPHRPIAYPHNIEEHVVGLEEDINELIGVLTTSDEARNFKVVSIVGMGGCGKTTLARKLFNHEIVKTHFRYMAWVSISQQWNTIKILVELLGKLSGETMTKDEGGSLGAIEERLHRFLERKRYLIVLDDVWTKQALEEILPTLQPLTNDGRKIIITTRKREVVGFPDLKCFFHEPRRLTEEESWDLFTKITLVHKVEELNNSLDSDVFEALGKKMLKKCDGLPLAVIALAGILSKKQTLKEWEKVDKAVSSWIVEEGRGTHLYGPVKRMLTLSYNDLPRELKPCFLYLAIFPEDYEIPIGTLCNMWIAEGFITSDQLHGEDTLEDVANQYLDELILRCVVQIGRRNYEGIVKTIRIHDLVRDLCIKKAKEQDFLEILSSNSPNSDSRIIELRRIAVHSHDGSPFTTNAQHLRSLVYKAVGGSRDTHLLSLQHIYENFRLLRVVFLEGIETQDGVLPTGIGSLIHLRYLRIYGTNITQLPSSIGNLCNLLTLDYRGVGNDRVPVRIPDVVWKMVGLRHLYLPWHPFLTTKEFTLKLHTLKYLRTLWGVQGGNWILEEIPLLTQTVEKLYIAKITGKKQLEMVFQCPSIKSDSLRSLRLKWQIGLRLESLQTIINCQHLRKLRLEGMIGERLGIQLPTSINKLVLMNTELKEDTTLATLGKLPNLIILKLGILSYLGSNWTCTARNHFPQLRELSLNTITNLEEWSIERGAMPLLTKLHVINCPELRSVPQGLEYITTLQELKLGHMGDEFSKRVKKGGEDAQLLQYIPLVQFV